jgi:O-antigen ligase
MFWQHLHNKYLQIIVEYGLIGFLLWVAALGLMVWPLLLRPTRSDHYFIAAFQISGLAFLIHNTVDILFVNSFDILFAFFVAFVFQSSRQPPSSKHLAGRPLSTEWTH